MKEKEEKKNEHIKENNNSNNNIDEDFADAPLPSLSIGNWNGSLVAVGLRQEGL